MCQKSELRNTDDTTSSFFTSLLWVIMIYSDFKFTAFTGFFPSGVYRRSMRSA